MTIADVLTILRLICVPFFLFAFLRGEYVIAFVLFTAAGVTDLVDGSIARWLKCSTELGALLDPVADKALMISTVSCLLLAKIIPVWFFLLIVVRDISILGGLAYLKLKKITFELKPVMASKIATLSNIIFVIFAFLELLGYPVQTWMVLFMMLSTVLVVISGCQYGYKGLQIIKRS